MPVENRLSLPLNPVFCRWLRKSDQAGGEPGTKRREIDMVDRNFESGTDPASPEEFFALGIECCNGHGDAPDRIAAHKWLNLAALKGNEDARAYRAELAREMSVEEMHEAQRQARAWLTLH